MSRLPEQGLSREALFARLEHYRRDDLDTHGGRTWAYVFDHGLAETGEIAEQAYLACLHENGLDPTVFPSVLRLETDIVDILAEHLHGDAETVGNGTSGGTESCMLAVKTARDYARRERGIREPTVVLPETAHAAFHKGAHYFDLETIVVPVDRLRPRAVC
jgi:sphinganine-1-phosphate aldolase